MAASITIGHTWVDGEQITSARLNQSVNSATIAGIDSTNMASAASIVTISDSAPGSPVEGQLWFDTSAAANEGKLKYYDGSHFVTLAEGFLGYNSSGSTIASGDLVKLATSTSGTANLRQEIARTTTIHDRAFGVAITQMVNGATGIVVTRGRVLRLNKTTGTAVTNGDAIAPTSTAGSANTGSVTGYGSAFGQAIGVWTSDVASNTTSGEAYIWGPTYSTFVAWLTTPSQRLTNQTNATDNAWSGASGTYMTWSATPPGVCARLIQFRLQSSTAAAADRNAVVAFRQVDSGLTVATGAAHMRCQWRTNAGAAADNLGMGGQLWVPTNPAAASGDKAEFLIKSDDTNANLTLDVWELAAAIGGRIS